MYPSFAGQPKLRSDATSCPTHLKDPEPLTEVLRDAIRSGRVGAPWMGDFPQYVGSFFEGAWYEGRLVNQEQGQYKGYPLRAHEVQEWMEHA